MKRARETASYRFLIVDDSTFSRMNLRGLLEENGHQVAAEAHNADEAISLYKTAKPDLVTMDLNMPQKTGVEAIRDIIAVDPNARFLVITSIEQDIVWKDCSEAASCEYVAKPVDWRKLRSAIDRLVKKTEGRAS